MLKATCDNLPVTRLSCTVWKDVVQYLKSPSGLYEFLFQLSPLLHVYAGVPCLLKLAILPRVLSPC
jgi:hypothetical protein